LRVGSLLVFMQNTSNRIIFATVMSRQLHASQKGGHEDGSAYPQRQTVDLASDPQRASIVLALANPGNPTDQSQLFHAFIEDRTVLAVLVDFPGILFVSFEPVLHCLQDLYKQNDIPFKKWIVPQTQCNTST